MSSLQTSIVLFVAVALAQPSALADDKPVPKPEGADARLEWIADQVAAYEVLRGVFGREVKPYALDWLARTNYPVKYQFALGIRMATHFPNLPKHQEDAQAKLVKTTIRLAAVNSEQEARLKNRLVKDESWRVGVLEDRATQLNDVKNAKALVTLEVRYNESITARDAADLARYAAQAPKEFLAMRQQLRDALLETLRKKPVLAKLFP